MNTSAIAVRALTRTSTIFRQTLPSNTRIVNPAIFKPRTVTTSAHAKPTFKRTNNNLDQDAGNYLTGASTVGQGDAIFLLVGGILALWVCGKISEEVKDVVWPKVKWMQRKVVGEEDGESK